MTAQYNPGLNSPEEMEADIRSALQVFKDSEYNYFVAAFYPELFAKIMGVAYEMNLAGDGKFWLITGTVSLAPFTLSGKLVAGKGMMNMYVRRLPLPKSCPYPVYYRL